MAKDAITWLQVNNWVPIIVSVVIVASSFFALQTRLALIEQKVEFIAKSQGEMLELFKSVENRYGLLSLDVKELQTVAGVE